MNDEFELESRLKKADPAKDFEPLDGIVVAKAMQSGKRSAGISYKAFRMALGGLGAGAFALTAVLVLPGALTPAPLFSIAGGSSATNLSAPAAESADSKMAAGYWPGYIEYNYIADGLSADGGRGKVYKAELVGNPTQILANLATLFGVEGVAKQDEWSTPEYPSYSISGENYSLNLYWSGTGSWSFNRWDPTAWSCQEAAPAEGDGSVSSDPETSVEPSQQICDGPTPTPELIPTESEMTAELDTILAKLGTELDKSLMTVYRDDWGSSLNIPYVVNGMELPISFYIGWDMRGELSYVSGNSFELKEAGEFKTISPSDAVARIADWRWSGSAPNSLYNNTASTRAGAEAATVDPVVSEHDSGAAESSIAVDEPSPDQPESIEPIQTEPQIVDLKVTRSENSMLGVWDASGGFWLVPGYILYNEQGWFSSIISLVEGVISLPAPIEMGVPLGEGIPVTKED
jgi:hypothetical protein